MRLVVSLAVLLAAPGCGGGAKRAVTSDRAESHARAWNADQAVDPGAFPLAAPYVSIGERMSYRLSMHELEVASFAIAVGEVTDLQGRPAVIVQSGVLASPLIAMVKKVEDNFTSWIDTTTSRPLLFRATELASADDDVQEGTDSEVAAVVDGAFPVRVRPAAGSEIVELQAVTEHPLFDLNSFLIALRGWDVEPGTTATADVIRSRFVWRTQVTMQGYESVVTSLGELPALRIDGASRRLNRDGTVDPKSDTRQYSLWISDDADRVPLLLVGRTDYGDIRMELIEYVAGTRRLR